jgi:Holliday junction resolvase-like predicted endonuclease
MFNNTKTNTQQGNVGEAKAIYELTVRGYGISRTLFDSDKYDLIADDGNTLLKVQVKSTRYKNKSGYYEAALKTTGGNTKSNTIRARATSDYDYLFVAADNGQCWFIPALLLGKMAVVLGPKWSEYELK